MLCLLIYLTLLLQCIYAKPLFNAKEHLYNYQFLNTTDPDPIVLKAAIKKLQRVFLLKETGIIDPDTLQKLTAPRCGRPSNIPQFALTNQKWRKFHLKYKIYNNTESLTKSQVSDIFKEAVAAWTKGVNLQLTETTTDSADIKIHFTQQDGPSHKLGYAFYPEHGGIYFDKDEDWTLNTQLGDSKIYFGWVAAHELGHALGLPHTETMQSVMFPYYSTVVTNPVENDVKRLKSLYGKSFLNNTNLCSGSSVHAILGGKELLFISENEYFIFSDGVIESGPYSLHTLYPNLPDKIDAAFNIGNTNFFFSNNVYYKYKNKKYTKKLISAGFDMPSNVDAAFYDPVKTTIYVFKGSKYYALNTKLKPNKRLIVNGKNISNDWEGVPNNIDAATLLSSSQVLFIKGTKCYRVDINLKELLETVNCLSTIYQC